MIDLPDNAINPYAQRYGEPIDSFTGYATSGKITPAALPMTVEQGNAIMLMMTRQCESLQNIEKLLVALNAKRFW